MWGAGVCAGSAARTGATGTASAVGTGWNGPADGLGRALGSPPINASSGPAAIERFGGADGCTGTGDGGADGIGMAGTLAVGGAVTTATSDTIAKTVCLVNRLHRAFVDGSRLRNGRVLHFAARDPSAW